MAKWQNGARAASDSRQLQRGQGFSGLVKVAAAAAAQVSGVKECPGPGGADAANGGTNKGGSKIDRPTFKPPDEKLRCRACSFPYTIVNLPYSSELCALAVNAC